MIRELCNYVAVNEDEIYQLIIHPSGKTYQYDEFMSDHLYRLIKNLHLVPNKKYIVKLIKNVDWNDYYEITHI